MSRATTVMAIIALLAAIHAPSGCAKSTIEAPSSDSDGDSDGDSDSDSDGDSDSDSDGDSDSDSDIDSDTDTDIDSDTDTDTDTDSDTGTGTDTGSDTDTGTGAICDPLTEVSHEGHCYYLDGSQGVCDPGYVLGAQAALYTIGPDFEGRDYKHTVSGNCCIYNSEPDEDFGMQDSCNAPGPFTAIDVVLGAMGCTDQTNFYPLQLTLCMSE